MSKLPQVTIICSVYNVSGFLYKYLEALKKQSFEDFLVLFINDGSADTSIHVIEYDIQKDDRFRYVHVDKDHNIYKGIVPDDPQKAVNYGIYATRNTALQLIKTKYFTIIDPDDWVDPDYLQILIQTADKTNADITKAELVKEYEDGAILKTTSNADIKSDMRKNRPIAQRFCGSQAITCLWRTSFVKNHNLRYKDRTDGFEYDSDDIFLLEALLHNPSIEFCNTKYHYVQRNTSVVHTINSKRFISTPKCREIEIQCLNRALAGDYDYTLSKLHYAIIVRRILWELAKHFRIYLKASDFKAYEYLDNCAQIVSQIKWNQYIDSKSLGFLEPLLSGNLKKAHARLSNPIFVLFDKYRLMSYGIS